jgi:hypothetical protein
MQLPYLLSCVPVFVRWQDNYFLDSASQINFFFEEKAFDESGKLQQAKELSINKIGHAMHDLDPVFRCGCSSAQQGTAKQCREAMMHQNAAVACSRSTHALYFEWLCQLGQVQAAKLHQTGLILAYCAAVCWLRGCSLPW